MANEYYTKTGSPATLSQGASKTIRDEYTLIETGLDKLPTLAGNGTEIVVINSAGTAQETTRALDVDSLTINGIVTDFTDATWGDPQTTDTTLVPAAGVNVDASGGTVIKSLPNPLVTGSVFQIHRMDNVPGNTCRIAANSNTIRFKDVDIGGDLTLAPGQTVKVVATSTAKAEIV